jgi:S-adenosylmethionine synthetase
MLIRDALKRFCLADKIAEIFNHRPAAIEQGLKLRNPIYKETAAYGHMRRTPHTIVKTFASPYFEDKAMEVELFTWEKLNYIDKVKEAFKL